MSGSKQPIPSLGERVKIARAKAGMSQDDLGRAVGTSREAISQIERGDSKVMRADNLLRIAQLLRVSPHWLVFGTETGTDLPAAGDDLRRPLYSWRQAMECNALKENEKMPKDTTEMIPVPMETAPAAYWLEVESDACGEVAAVGDLILVDPTAETRSGSYVIVVMGGSPVMRRLVIDGGTRIVIANGPGWDGLREKLDDEAQILGRVVLVCRRL